VTDHERLTELLQRLDPDDARSAEAALSLVYGQLRALAAGQMRRERRGHTLQPTELVHEAWMRLASGGSLEVADRRHFFRLAGRAMRQVLVDAARRRNAERRGGGAAPVTLRTDVGGEAPAILDVLVLEDALSRLAEHDEDWASLVELRFFTGLTVDEAAETLGISPRKAAKDWAAIRIWLARTLREE
jgi:RNA polymerase sigma factor (TIGR02999 family)